MFPDSTHNTNHSQHEPLAIQEPLATHQTLATHGPRFRRHAHISIFNKDNVALGSVIRQRFRGALGFNPVGSPSLHPSNIFITCQAFIMADGPKRSRGDSSDFGNTLFFACGCAGTTGQTKSLLPLQCKPRHPNLPLFIDPSCC